MFTLDPLKINIISAKVNLVISNSGTFFTVACHSPIIVRILVGPLNSWALYGVYYLNRISTTSILCQLAVKNILTTAFAVNYDVMSGGSHGLSPKAIFNRQAYKGRAVPLFF